MIAVRLAGHPERLVGVAAGDWLSRAGVCNTLDHDYASACLFLFAQTTTHRLDRQAANGKGRNEHDHGAGRPEAHQF